VSIQVNSKGEMSAKAISEASGKDLLNRQLSGTCAPSRCAVVNESTDFDQLLFANSWLKDQKLVVKPDQLIKRRGKLGLIGVNLDWAGVKAWINERIGKDVKVCRITCYTYMYIPSKMRLVVS